MSKTLSVKYYQENKERLQKKVCERYQNLSKEEKQKKRQYGRERYKNLSEDEKAKSLLSIEEKYYRTRKKRFIIIIKLCFLVRKRISIFLIARLCKLPPENIRSFF